MIILKSDTVEITINNSTLRWYIEKGYDIPTEIVQLYCLNKNGKKIKNGIDRRVKLGTKIIVNVNDLSPKSNEIITFICEDCGNEFTTTWQAYKIKHTNKCRVCQCKTIKNTGSHSYWVNQLIVNNPNAKCDISGETDKRFLILHHLLSRNNGGLDKKSNYVILSANYHLAFHCWNGGTNIPCTPEQYYEFKRKEVV